jgi:hypothetical protein
VNDLGIHLLLFSGIGIGIVTMAALYSDSVDASALRGLPRRFLVFAFGCGVLAALLIVAEMTVASAR